MNSKSAQVALITGAARRIGATIAEELHRQDMNVVIHFNKSSEQALELAKKLNAIRNNSAWTIKADLNQPESYQTLITSAIDHWGRLDCLVNNASSFFPTDIKVASVTEWDKLLNSNLKAPFFLSQAAATELSKQQGSIINIIDIHGFKPLKNYSIYSMAKAGLVMLTKSLALELAPNIRVNGVAPGAVLWPEGINELDETLKQKIIDKTPLQHPGSPDDIAKAVRFFIAQTYVTGQILCVDGGRSLR